MNFSLALSEISYPFSHNLQQKNEKSVASRPFLRLVMSNKKTHLQLSNRDVGTMEVSQSLMPGHVQESYMGEKHLEDEARRKVKFVRTLLIDNYDSYTYNIYQELSVINGVPPVVVHNDALTWEYLHYHLYEEKSFDNIVISPGPGSPMCPTDIGDRFFWSYIPELFIRNSWFPCMWNLRWWNETKPNVSPPQYFQILLECKDIPILGVCLGHQALGYAHGARIVHAPEPVHGRLSEIEHTGCNLFLDIPSGHNSGFKVVRYHSLIIDADSLPKELIPIAWSSSKDTQSFRENRESNLITDASEEQIGSTKIIMGIMHSTRPHYGVQFHPESVATCHGRQIFQNFKKMTIDYWQKSSPIHERKVPHASRIFKELPMSRLLVNNLDGGNHLNKCKQIMHANGSTCATSLKLKWKKFDRLVSQVGGAKNIFCNLFGDQKAENTFWLDSSSVEQKRARFSFMGGKGGALWRQITFRLFKKSDKIASGGGCLSIEDAQGFVESRYLEHGFLNFLDKELQSFSYEKEDYEGLPFDFVGGYVGFMGYGLKVECGVASNSHDSRTPDACFFFADNIVVIDHLYDDLYILCVNNASLPESTAWPLERTMSSWLDDTEQKLLCLKTSSTEKFKEKVSLSVAPCEAGFQGEKSRDQYMKDVEKCLNYIKDGESYELCLTTQMRKSIGNIDSLGLYLSLRGKNPAPFAAWFNFSKENLSICCSSPERFLQLDRNGILEAKPIKGTIARGSTSAEDQQLKLKLQHSEKDQAENLMIVDLLRNDLGRVCEPGSVHVPRLMEVESYATVHTLVSTIRGKKCSNLSPVDCVRAAFPGGSMTGAPKLRSMEILDSLENCARGVYSGSIGFFSYNQTFDLNIVIRTVIVHDGEASVGAGGAIVALSNPEDEYEEMVLKTRAPVKTVMEFEST